VKKGAKKVALINIEPDQYLAVTSQTKKYLAATVVKRVDKAIVDIISKSLSGDQFLDYLDLDAGLFGSRYGINGGGIEFTVRSKELLAKSDAINIAAAKAEKITA
jgi:basic membrane protein A